MSKYDEFAVDINRYLSSKLPVLDEATAMEVSEYISNRINRLIVSVIEEHDRDWRRAMKKHSEHLYRQLDRLQKKVQ